MEDSIYQQYVSYLENGTLPIHFRSNKGNFIAAANKFDIRGNILYRNGKIVVKSSEKDELWLQHAHSGRDAFYSRLKTRYYFRGMEKWVRNKTNECVACAHKNSKIWPSFLSPLKPIPVTPKMMWRVHLDLMGPFPLTTRGNRYVGVAVCALSKFPEAEGKNAFTS